MWGASDNWKWKVVERPYVLAIVGVSCALSAVGSLFIIFSYLCFKNFRTKSREILLHISLMDLGVSVANLTGIAVNYDEKWFKCYYVMDGSPTDTTSANGEILYNNSCVVDKVIRDSCVAQAAFAHFFTIGSVLWTLALPVYLYFLIVHHGTSKARYVLWSSYFMCYGLPLYVTVWMLADSRLGYNRFGSSGWCTLIDVYNRDHNNTNIFINIMSYDLWIFLTFFVTAVLVVSTYLHMRYCEHHYFAAEVASTVQTVEYKLMAIPVAFFLLRVWSEVNVIIHIQQGAASSVPIVLDILGGIGDSSQGFVNAILYVLLTKNVRKQYINISKRTFKPFTIQSHVTC